MSLLGIDVGSSAVKAAAYSVDGALIGVARSELDPSHPQPGWWEQDPEQVWQALVGCVRELMQLAALRHDPPGTLAISASGREVFPVDASGQPLGNCLMGADIRGAEYEQPPPGAPQPEPWTLRCGHPRERMDPLFRLLWWRATQPQIAASARWFLGWHEFLTLRLCGVPVTDHSLASRWQIYDLECGGWDPARLNEHAVDPAQLPELGAWGTQIGTVRPAIAAALGLPPGVSVAVGGHDINCATIGVGVAEAGVACLSSGSYENVLMPGPQLPTATMLARGLSVMPHPGQARFATLAVSPTGNAVVNWTRELLGMTPDAIDGSVAARAEAVSPVLAVPYLSGAMLHWDGGRRARGALLGLTLATDRTQILQAVLESIAYDHVSTLALLAQEQLPVRRLHATGGGVQSAWWTQLKSDLTGVPIAVIEQPEPGAFGAVLLAGFAAGNFADLDRTSTALTPVRRWFEPDPARAALHAEKLHAYRAAVGSLLQTVYAA